MRYAKGHICSVLMAVVKNPDSAFRKMESIEGFEQRIPLHFNRIFLALMPGKRLGGKPEAPAEFKQELGCLTHGGNSEGWEGSYSQCIWKSQQNLLLHWICLCEERN